MPMRVISANGPCRRTPTRRISPVFNAMQETIVKLTNGTNGDFCIRCHTQTGMALHEPISLVPWTGRQARGGGHLRRLTASTSRRAQDEFGEYVEPGNLQIASTARRETRTSRWSWRTPTSTAP